MLEELLEDKEAKEAMLGVLVREAMLEELDMEAKLEELE